MAETKKLKIESPDWNIKRRYKVNSVVSHIGSEWQNITGINTEPSQSSTDWFLSKDNSPKGFTTVEIEGEVFLWFKKAANNTGNPLQNETAKGVIGNTEYSLKYNTGDVSLLASWTILNSQQLF